MLARRPPPDVSRAPMPDRLVRIGELSEMLGISRRAIRHYEKHGLVEPIRGNADARLFDEAARRRLEWIAELRSAGIGLRDIDEILALPVGAGRQGQLQMTVAKLEARATQLRAEVGRIDSAIDAARAALAGAVRAGQ